jgi:cation diffusion facilitator family transporter
VGARNLKPVNRSIWGIEEADGPITGSAMVEYNFDLPESPKTDTPPTGGDSDDPHDKVRKLDPSYDQSDKFFREGIVTNFCNGACDCEEVLASTLSADDKLSCSKGTKLAMSSGGSLRVIIGSLVANLGIAAAKGVAAYFTGSGAMLAESIHSAADCTNQILLLVGAKQAEQPPDETHPLGYGRSAYFWSFLVALMIFLGGGVMSIREGVHKVLVPDPVEHVWIGFVILGVSLVLEAGAMVQAMVALNKKRGKTPFFAYLSATTDVDLVLLFAENGAAVIGLSFAMIALGMAAVTGDARWDGYGSIMIGILLTLVAFFLAREVKSLLEGERADPSIDADFRAEVAADPRLGEVLRVLTVQQGPSQVMLMAKIKPSPDLTSPALITAINDLEARMRARRSEIRWQFIEPDDRD